jgi:hypothetical protein
VILLANAFPQLAKDIARELRLIGRDDLAEQAKGLRIFERCRCGADRCGTFFTTFSWIPEGNTSGTTDVLLGNGVIVTAGKIISRIETVDPEVNAVLRELFP